jgi:hypothetical protein
MLRFRAGFGAENESWPGFERGPTMIGVVVTEVTVEGRFRRAHGDLYAPSRT